MFSISEEEFKEACENNQGICLECNEFQDCVEPDARNYLCDNCGKNEVYGMEEALIWGKIDIE